jgi:hypothetical protein
LKEICYIFNKVNEIHNLETCLINRSAEKLPN